MRRHLPIQQHDADQRTEQLSLALGQPGTYGGMVVFDYASRYAQAVSEIAAWIAAGKLKSREDIVEGLETFPETLLKLFSGENFGKLVLKIADA